MTENIFKEKLNEIRYQYVDRKKQKKGDIFLSKWLEVKITGTQSMSARVIRNLEKSLQKFFNQKEISQLFELNEKKAEKALYKEISDSAKTYQESCLSDSTYGSKLFSLMKMKPEEIANKAGEEVYTIVIPVLMGMSDYIWRNQMITAIHLAYQEVFIENAKRVEDYYDNPDMLEKFHTIINQTIHRKNLL